MLNFENLFETTEGAACEPLNVEILAKYTDDKYFSWFAS